MAKELLAVFFDKEGVFHYKYSPEGQLNGITCKFYTVSLILCLANSLSYGPQFSDTTSIRQYTVCQADFYETLDCASASPAILTRNSSMQLFHMGDLHRVEANVLDCDIGVSEFELQSHYYVHFRTNTLGKGMNLLISPLAKILVK